MRIERELQSKQTFPGVPQTKDFDEDKHPRDSRGRFGSGDGAEPAAPAAITPEHWREKNSGPYGSDKGYEHISGGSVSARGYARVEPSEAWPSGIKPGWMAHDGHGGYLGEGFATPQEAAAVVEAQGIPKGYWRYLNLGDRFGDGKLK